MPEGAPGAATETVAELLAVEASELAAAAALALDARTGPDASQRPRQVAVWLLLGTGTDRHTRGRNAVLLDGLAAWLAAEGVTAALRSTVVAGPDTSAAMKVLAREATEVACARDAAGMLALRWRDMEGKLRCEARPLPVCDGVPDATVRVHAEAAQLAVTWRAPLPAVAYRAPALRLASRGAFARLVSSAAQKFSSEVATTPSITRAPHVAHECGPLEPIGVFVRVLPRQSGAAVSTDAFHGVVLAPQHQREAARAHCARAAHTHAELSAPRSVAEGALGLHLCAVQAERRHLTTRVSLFGNTGRPGAPIHEPGSRLVATAAAVRPLDDALCDAFCVVPCAREALLPHEPELHAGFARFFGACERLCTSLTLSEPSSSVLADPPPYTTPRVGATSEFAREARAPLGGDERAMLAALRLDLGSQRTTLGDALATAVESGAPAGLVELLIASVRALGVGATLSEMIANCTRAVARDGWTTPNVEGENSRLKRLCTVALRLERSCPAQPKVAACDDVVLHRLLRGCELKRGPVLVLRRERSNMQFAHVARVLAAALCLPFAVGLATIEHVEVVLENAVRGAPPSGWAHAVGTAVPKAVQVAAAADVEANTLFVLEKNAQYSTHLSAMRTDSGDPPRPATADEMLHAAEPRVLFVQVLRDDALRLCACVSTKRPSK